MNRFEKAANFAKKHRMDLPPKVKGLKLLHDAGLSVQDLKLVQAKKGLAKYIAGRGLRTDGPAIKLEGAFTADQNDLLEESFLSRGWSKLGRGEKAGRGEAVREEDSAAPAPGPKIPRTRKTPRGTP